ncbi:MAG: response regulator [Patescibacteria group bacterium]
MSKKILFIEDESALQRAMGDMLKSHGYEVIQALNGEIGEHLAESEQPALILLDLVIPQKDGYEILSELQKNPATKAIPIIVLTNLEGTEEIEKALSLGARTYLVKARYTLEEVITKVKSAIGE